MADFATSQPSSVDARRHQQKVAPIMTMGLSDAGLRRLLTGVELLPGEEPLWLRSPVPRETRRLAGCIANEKDGYFVNYGNPDSLALLAWEDLAEIVDEAERRGDVTSSDHAPVTAYAILDFCDASGSIVDDMTIVSHEAFERLRIRLGWVEEPRA